jgi:hypothetical protein
MLPVELAESQRYQSLTLFPLITSYEAELPYTLLVDALHAGTVSITEVGAGTVPELLATNESGSDILILDGEQLIGARQNRMTNRTLLLPSKSTTKIPVSCMEQGRWRPVSEKFTPADQHSPSKVRRTVREREAHFADSGVAAPQEALAGAQGAVWSSIAEHAGKVGGRSSTGALDDLYQARAADIGAWVAPFVLVPGQVGLLAFLGDRPLGMDVIGGRALYGRLHGRLLRGYVMDALESPTATAEVTREAAQAFLDRTREAERVEAPTVGRGRYSVLARTVVGGELVDGERVAHLSAFPRRGREGGGPGARRESYIQPPSRRRGR